MAVTIADREERNNQFITLKLFAFAFHSVSFLQQKKKKNCSVYYINSMYLSVFYNTLDS